jgi:hypothetical protein
MQEQQIKEKHHKIIRWDEWDTTLSDDTVIHHSKPIYKKEYDW